MMLDVTYGSKVSHYDVNVKRCHLNSILVLLILLACYTV